MLYCMVKCILLLMDRRYSFNMSWQRVQIKKKRGWGDNVSDLEEQWRFQEGEGEEEGQNLWQRFQNTFKPPGQKKQEEEKRQTERLLEEGVAEYDAQGDNVRKSMDENGEYEHPKPTFVESVLHHKQQQQPEKPFNPLGALFSPSSDRWGNDCKGSDWIKAQKENHGFELMGLSCLGTASTFDNQIIHVEPSQNEDLLVKLREEGGKFRDNKFPPTESSLCGEWGSCPEWEGVEWANISQVMPDAQIFVDKPTPQDIRQGQLGDCYFLAALAALAERPDRIFEIFITDDRNDICHYAVKVLYKGKWVIVDMDEAIPWRDNNFFFSRTQEKELWVVILEKAWAKLYSSYKRIEAGYPEEALHDLSGAPIKNIYLKKDERQMEETWKYLSKASLFEYAMVCSSNAGSDRNKSNWGVVQGHAYTLLQVCVLFVLDEKIKLVQLRNPWGAVEYTEDWSDRDPVWNEVSEKEKERIGFKKDSDDGIFFMPWQKFWKEFASVTVAEINDNASYVYKSKRDPEGKGVYFNLDIKKKGKYSLQVDKTPDRSFEYTQQDEYAYPYAAVQINAYDGKTAQGIKGFGDDKRLTQGKYFLAPGTYLVKVEVEFDRDFEKDFDVNLAIYAEHACELKLATPDEAQMMSRKQEVEWSGEEDEVRPWNLLAHFGFKEPEEQKEEQRSEKPGFIEQAVEQAQDRASEKNYEGHY